MDRQPTDTGNTLLLVFAKNLELGKVKTRLAKTIGEVKALEIYTELVSYTEKVIRELPGAKTICYSAYIEKFDVFKSKFYTKKKQVGEELGERMKNAFKDAFLVGDYQKVILIGTDCLEVTTSIIEEAYIQLSSHDVVIGPTKDGGYYLLGMKRPLSYLFENKEWSTDSVFLDTVSDLKKNKVSYSLLETLSDVDEEKDLGVLRSRVVRDD